MQLGTTLAAIFFAAITLAFAGSAIAAPCKTQGSKEAKELMFDMTDKEVLRGLRASFYLGLRAPDLPAKFVREMKAPCTRGTFAAGGASFEIFGENSDHPGRWAMTPDRPDFIFYLALMPKPDAARKWEDAGSKYDSNDAVSFQDGEWMYAVALTTGDEKRLVFKFFDDIPDDERLKPLLQTIAGDQSRWLIRYNNKTNEATPNASR